MPATVRYLGGRELGASPRLRYSWTPLISGTGPCARLHRRGGGRPRACHNEGIDSYCLSDKHYDSNDNAMILTVTKGMTVRLEKQ